MSHATGRIAELEAELRATQQRLASTEARLQAVQAQARVLVFTIDRTGRCAYLAAPDDTGGLQVGASLMSFPATVAGAAGAALAGARMRCEIELGPATYDCLLVPVRDALGAITHVEVVGTDISARKEAESALYASGRRLRAMIEKSHDAITLLSPTAQTLYQSPAARRLLGYSFEETQGMAWTDFVDADQHPRLAATLGRILGAPGATESIEFPVRRRDGKRIWIELTATNLLDDPDVAAIVANFRDVTDHRAMQRERDQLFNLSPGVMCVGDLDGRVRRMNPAFEQVLGWTAEDMAARYYLDLIHPDDRPHTIQAHARLASGQPVEVENRVLRKDGEYRWLHWSAAASLEDGRFYATAHDVTAWREAAERDRLLFKSSPSPMWLLDAGTARFVEVNDAALALYGYTREEFTARRLWDVIPDDQHPVAAAQMQHVLATGSLHITDRQHRTKRGDLLDVHVTAHALRIGTRRAYISVIDDVTERNRIQRALRVSDARYRRIVENTSEGVVTYNAEGDITFANQRFADMFDETRDALVGRSMTELLQPAFSERVTIQRSRRDGSRVWITYRTDPLYDDAGRFEGSLILATDVTAEEQARLQLKHAEDQLRQAQKMEAIGNLAGGVAHDFNNLLTVIITSAELALDEIPAQSLARSDLHEVREAANRATELTRQLLAFSRKQVLQPHVVDLNRTIDGLASMLRRLVGEHIAVSVQPCAEPTRIYADRGQLEQVLMNLVVNARDAMPGGGQVTIETRIEHVVLGDHTTVPPGAYVVMEVADNGVGMDAATQARVFEPFFTTKDKSNGTGLGLSTVYGIVQQSDGHIRIDSTPAAGTTFRVYLPLTERPCASAPVIAPAPAKLGSETILLVEDELQLRDTIRTVLRKSGYTVLEAQNGGEAFLLCEQYQGEIHLLLTDMVMPRMNGRQLADRLRLARPTMDVLFVSGYASNQPAGGDAFLAKPFTPDVLLRKVRTVLTPDAPRIDAG